MAQQTPGYVISAATHSAALFRQANDASYVRRGVLGASEYNVAQQASPNMSVQVGAGRALVPGTQGVTPAGFNWSTQGSYFVENDGAATVTLAASNPTNPRIDVVYVAVQDAFYSGSNNQVVLGVVTGVASSSPVTPSVPANAIALANVAVAANATTIVNANITNLANASTLLAMALGGIMPVTGSSAYPTNPYIGQVIDDLSLGMLRWNGSAWQSIMGAAGVLQAHAAGTNTITNSGSTWSSVTIDTTDTNTRGWTTGASGFLVPATGTFLMLGGVNFAGAATGSRGARFANGTTGYSSTASLYPGFGNSGGALLPTIPAVVAATAGDGIFLQGLQNSGGNISTVAGSQLTVVRVT